MAVKRRVLITGANGFIGRSLVNRLADEYELYLVDTGKSRKRSDCHWIEIDLAGDVGLSDFPEEVEAVIHLAQSRNYRDFPASAIDIFGVNAVSTLKLLEWSRKARVKKFLLASSASVYKGSRQVLRETDVWAPPEGFYAVSKYSAELLARSYSQFMSVVRFRFITVYGPGQQGMLIPNLITRVLKGSPITIAGRKGIRMNPIYIDDAVEAIVRSLHLKNSAVMNVGGTEALSVLDMGKIIGKALHREPKFEYLPERGKNDLVGDISEMKKLLAFTPRMGFEEGVRRTVEGFPELA